MMNAMVYIDAGHGGVSDKGYVYCKANGKKTDGDGWVFYEGINNRLWAKKLEQQLLSTISDDIDIDVQLVYNEVLDTSLSTRVSIANDPSASENYDQILFVSLHSNAYSEESANGWEIHIYENLAEDSKGYLLAECIEDMVCNISTTRMRGIKRSNFQVLRETHMPAVLIESGFFTNPDDRSKLTSIGFINSMTRAYADGILNYLSIQYDKAGALQS